MLQDAFGQTPQLIIRSTSRKYDRTPIWIRKTRSLSVRQTAKLSQQPKTSLNDAFKLLRRCEHCETVKRTDETRNGARATTGRYTEEKAEF
jgi:hypothetical protein